MRHSQAAPTDYRTRDMARWLTNAGRGMARVAGRALKEHAQHIDCIVTSPVVRAVQTAEIVAAVLEWEGEIISFESLRSESPVEEALEDLQALTCGRILALSHEPMVSNLSGKLAGQDSGDFKTAYQTAEIRSFCDGAQTWRWLV